MCLYNLYMSIIYRHTSIDLIRSHLNEQQIGWLYKWPTCILVFYTYIHRTESFLINLDVIRLNTPKPVKLRHMLTDVILI